MVKMESFESDLRVHLGCGSKYLPGYINVDQRPGEGTDLVADMEDLPFKKESISIIYLCHSLEHIRLLRVKDYLAYLYQLLAPGGAIYISVPDFERLTSMYLARIVSLPLIVRAIHGGQEYEGNTHFISFDQYFLGSLMREAGFQSVSRYEPKEFLPQGFEDTSTYAIAGKQISLNLKGTK